MLLDARTLANGATLEADVCIAGAGAAGITIALDLRASGLSVILLESGGMDRAEETQVLSEGQDDRHRHMGYAGTARARIWRNHRTLGRLVSSVDAHGLRSQGLREPQWLACCLR